MRRKNRESVFTTRLLPAVVLCLACLALRAENFELQTVVASVPGKPGGVPESLKKYKVALLTSTYSRFSDGGVQTVAFTAAVPKTSAKVGKYTLEFTQQPDSKMEVLVKEGTKTVLAPLTYSFAKERTKQLELSAPGGGMYILFLTKPKE